MRELETGQWVIVLKTESCKFYKNTICIIDKIEHYKCGLILYRLKYKDSFGRYGRKGFKLYNSPN